MEYALLLRPGTSVGGQQKCPLTANARSTVASTQGGGGEARFSPNIARQSREGSAGSASTLTSGLASVRLECGRPRSVTRADVTN